jgi:hypothetical protein
MAGPAGAATAGQESRDLARRHNLIRHTPTPDFFEGMLLGNGDIGVCAVVRPDALGLHLGKEDVWDIRVSEEHVRHLLPFSKLLEFWQEAGDAAKRQGVPRQTHLETWYPPMAEYTKKMRSSYSKPWPRPWPCGTVWIHWDSRLVRLVRQELDIGAGVLTVTLEYDDLRGAVRQFRLECFVSFSEGHVSVSSDIPAPILSVAYYPHFDPQTRMPEPELAAGATEFSAFQLLPATAPTDEQPDPPGSPNDRTFALCGMLSGTWSASPPDPRRKRCFLHRTGEHPFRLDLVLLTSLEAPHNRDAAREAALRISYAPSGQTRAASIEEWRKFWSRSAVELADRELEQIWYHNQYFLACCLKQGKVAPGLFGNWSSGNIGTAWHGDYHMNYNTQQVFWGVFSSNHVEQHLPYVDLVEKLMPMAEWNARVQFGLPGAYFPHSAYPVPSQVNPYPVPPWGYEICETPWTVQSLWWHYLYTLDEQFLARAYGPLKAAAVFLAAYLKKGSDGKYHIIPTVSPENWGLTPDFCLNRDCIIDLALTEFLFDAIIETSRILNRDEADREKWSEIRRNLASYPEATGPYGRVWLDIVDAPAEWVYNVPVTLSPVFPCEQVGLGRGEKMMEIATRTTRTVRLEGGNDLVWLPLVKARLGTLDLEWFKREVGYCRLPNGIAQDRVRQVGGRYRDETNYDFMTRMGIWTENLSLPAVINESLMQSWTGVIRLFPIRQGLGRARFRNLRAVGAFLISAEWDGARVSGVRIHSEKGARARLLNPWPGRKVRVTPDAKVEESGGEVVFPTQAGKSYSIEPA